MKKSPAAAKKRSASGAKAARELDELRSRLEEAEETLDAIRKGQVEALVVAGPSGPRIFTLEGADHRYRRLVETMNEGALLLAPSGLILYANAAFAALVDERLERVVGRPLRELVDPESLPRFHAMLAAAGRSGAADELLLRGPERVAISTHVSMSPNDDHELGVCVIVTNLTAQKRNEEIVASERLARSILDQAAEAIVVCDEAGIVTRASRPAQAIAEGESVRRHVGEAFPLRALPNAEETQHPALRAIEGEISVAVEMVLERAGHSPMSVLCTAAPLVNERKRILGCVMSVVDITLRKQVEAERAELLDAERAARAAAERARAEAEASNRSKDEFLATVSHELRTPLNAIVGWSRLMTEGTMPDERRQKGLAVIRRNADAQARLIEDLLDVSRIISGKMRLEVQPLEPRQIIDSVIESVRPALEAKEIHLDVTLEPEPATVLGDAARVQQVIWNLLANAAKFTDRNGRIQIVLRRVDAFVEVVVADNGKGIEPEFLPYVFDRFRQADGGISRTHGGLGLGLAISRHLVELHGGRIEVASEGDHKGATFTVRLPRASARTATSAEGDPISEPPASFGGSRKELERVDLQGIRVLVVEDDQDSRDLLVGILASSGAEVEATLSGEEALALLAAAPFDVLVSDIGMPVMDGYALLRCVRALPDERAKRVPALALTAYARPEDRRRALLAGFQMHLSKPVDPGELGTIVASLARYSALAR